MGTVSVIEGGDARALSLDGRTWQVQAKALPPLNLWGSVQAEGEKRYFRFGNWTPERGLDRIPVNPIIDTKSMLVATDKLVVALEAAVEQLPFPLSDFFELWLLDGLDHRPFALLDTATNDTVDDVLRGAADAHWHAVRSGDFSFVSATLEQQGIPNKDDYSPRRHAEAIEALVRHRAEPTPTLRWFRRQPDGSGIAFVPPDTVQPALSADDFPTLPLCTHWRDETGQRMIDDYVNWLAPRLLTLHMDDAMRSHLELAASQQPLEMDRLWHLYPKILDQERLIKVRVEARIRRAG